MFGWCCATISLILDGEKNGYVARDQLLICPIVKGWTYARSTRYVIRARSRGSKDQSGLSYRFHYRETLSPPPAGDAKSTNFGLLAATS